MEIEIYSKKWNKEYVISNPDKVFVFGDNNARVGKGGQATIRGLENSVGIRTKKGPSKKDVAFYKDSEFENNKSKIDEDILNIKYLSLSGKKIVFSKNGYGTGLASLKHKAPKTFKYLNDSLKNHFGFDNEKGSKWSEIPGNDDISNGIYVNLDDTKEILQPNTNKLFRHELLESNLNTNFDLIKLDKKIAFTHKKEYKEGDIIIFTLPGKSEYLLTRSVMSYKLDDIDLKKWSMFEGYKEEFIKSIKDSQNGEYYQTHFHYICSLDSRNGRMIFRNDIFGDLSEKKILDKKVKINPEKVIKTGPKLIKENFSNVNKKDTIDLHENKETNNNIKNIDTNLEKIQLLELVNSMKEEISELKKPFYVRLFEYLSNRFSRKSIDHILKKKGLKGQLLVIDNLLNDDKNKIYYHLTTDKYKYFLVLYKGLFINRVYILLKLTNNDRITEKN